jgi:4-hydroxy-L-threonine phosphate dehydrogenase PdxA
VNVDTRIGVAVGDPNGVGPEIAVKAALELHERTGARALLIGEDYILRQTCDQLGIPQEVTRAFDIHHVGALMPSEWKPGTITAAAGGATASYVREALLLLRDGKIDAIGAAPHCEEAVNAAGIPFSGYGGLIADLTGTPREQVFLMLEAAGLRVIHCTLHQGVVAAVQSLTPALVEAATHAARRTLTHLGIPQPRICVLGINPHAGEGGLFGDEDERITRPAVRAMQARGWTVDGPLGADVALSERKHDAYVAMLHDQGHIAVKMISPKGSTALVAGLPLLFASVGHGAAFDIAGKGIADPAALTETLLLLAQAAG